MQIYWLSILGILALCLVSILLAIYSGVSKGRAGALAGPVVPANEDDRLYRIDRAHLNSVEALAVFVVPAILAMQVGVGPDLLATLVLLHLAIRVAHAAIYLRGGPAARGGHLRTGLYLSGAAVALILICVTGWATLA